LCDMVSFQDFGLYSSSGIISAISAHILAFERCAKVAMP
jgi:hypothetical protein